MAAIIHNAITRPRTSTGVCSCMRELIVVMNDDPAIPMSTRATSSSGMVGALEATINAADFHRRGAVGMAETAAALQTVEGDLEQTMQRWLDLEARADGAR